VACVKEKRNAYKVLLGKPELQGHFQDLGVDLKIILKMYLQEMACGRVLD